MGVVGDRLRLQRQARGISIEHIARQTKISARWLEAIEREHFEQLPGGIFTRSFIRQYARSIGLDDDPVIREFLARAADEEAAQALPLKAPSSRLVRDRIFRFSLDPGIVLAMILAGVLAFAAALWPGFAPRGQSPLPLQQRHGEVKPEPASAIPLSPQADKVDGVVLSSPSYEPELAMESSDAAPSPSLQR